LLYDYFGDKDVEERLSQEEIQMGVCGGGLTEGLDGKTFRIEVVEVK